MGSGTKSTKKNKRPRFRNRPKGENHRELLSDPRAHRTNVRVFAYGADTYSEKSVGSLDYLPEMQQEYSTIWVCVEGLADVAVIRHICEAFDIHPLAQEDIVRTHQRPKIEDYNDGMFIVSRVPPHDGLDETEQVSIYLKNNAVVTFQEYDTELLDGVIKRLHEARGRIRGEGADYLAYAVLDAVVDSYFPLLEKYGDEVEELEDRLIQQADARTLDDIYTLRRRFLEMRRSVWPMREMLGSLYRGDSPLIRPSSQVFFRDCYDHTVQVIDLMENYRELTSNLMDVYLSTVSNRLNEIMKVLTIISVIFIPLTFVAGVYGMNFNPQSSPYNMPELLSYYGYPLCLAGMVVIAMIQLMYFRSKGWIGGGGRRRSSDDESTRRPKELETQFSKQEVKPIVRSR